MGMDFKLAKALRLGDKICYEIDLKMGKVVTDHQLNDSIMADLLTKEQTIDEIVKVARKLDKMDLQILLMRLRVKKMVKEKRKPVANYDSRKIKAPKMEEINAWTHEARKQHEGK